MIVGNVEAGGWYSAYHHTHNGLQRIEWPDGGCYFEQWQLTVDIFDMIEAEIRQYLKEQK